MILVFYLSMVHAHPRHLERHLLVQMVEEKVQVVESKAYYQPDNRVFEQLQMKQRLQQQIPQRVQIYQL